MNVHTHLLLRSLLAAGLLTANTGFAITIADLGTLGGSYSYPSAINNLGQVTGSSSTADGEEHAFLYSNGTMTDLGTLGGTQSVGSDINNLGQITGWSFTNTDDRTHAIIYSNGTMMAIGSVSGVDSYAGEGINDAGQVTGGAFTDISTGGIATISAFLYNNNNGTMMALGAQEGGNATFKSFGFDINNAGQVTGILLRSPFRYSNGIMTQIPASVRD